MRTNNRNISWRGNTQRCKGSKFFNILEESMIVPKAGG
jgi:hypothetical protein